MIFKIELMINGRLGRLNGGGDLFGDGCSINSAIIGGSTSHLPR